MFAHKFSLLRQLLWAATLATGFGTLWSVLIVWLNDSIEQAWQGGNWPPQETLEVRTDGELLIQSTPRKNPSRTTYRDLNGRAQETPDRNDMLAANYMFGEYGTPHFMFSSIGWEQKLRVFIDEREPTVNWFFVHDGKPQGAGYFVAYERVSNRRIGFIGLSGFGSNPVPTVEWIPVRDELIRYYSQWSSAPLSIYSGQWSVVRPNRWDVPPRLVYVPSGNLLQKVDLHARTVMTVFEAPEPIESLSVPTLSQWSAGPLTKERPILMRTRQKIHALDHDHNVIKVFTIPTEIDRRSPVQWYEIGNGEAVADFTLSRTMEEADDLAKHMVYRIAEDGAIRNRLELTLQTGTPATYKKARNFMLAVGLPAPAILFVVDLLVLVGIDRIQTYQAPDCHSWRCSPWHRSWPSWPGAGVARSASRSANRLRGQSLFFFLGSQPSWDFGSIVAGRSDSPVRIVAFRLPAIVLHARSAVHASRILR